jgi:hypothetical protein
MKFSISIFITLIFLNVSTRAQDGSDIRYIDIGNVDATYIGKTIHLDFYNRSFASRKRDSITILVNNNPITFLEHREDNGFNNWFSRQYFEEIKKTKSEHLRIIKSVVKEVTYDSVLVTSYFVLYSKDNYPVEGKSFTQDIWFKRNVLSQILVQSEQCCK